MRSEALKKAQQKYRQSRKRFSITFYQTDKDIEEHLYKQEHKQAYIKELIRADMEKNNTENTKG
jgi:hypothetical protein